MYRLLMTLTFISCLFNQLDAQPYQCEHLMAGHQSPVTYLCLRGEGNLLVSGSTSGDIIFWDIEKGEKLNKLVEHSGEITHLEFSPDGKTLASASYDGTIKIWDIDNQSLVQSIEVPAIPPYADVNGNEPTFLAYDPSGNSLFFGGYNTQIHKFTFKDKIITKLFEHPEFGITTGLLSSDKEELLFAAGAMVYSLDINDEEVKEKFILGNEKEADSYVCELAVNDHQLLAAWTYGGLINLYDLNTDKFKSNLKATEKKGSSNLSFCAEGYYLVTGNSKNDVKLWDIKKDEVLQYFRKHQKSVTAFTVSKDSKYIVTGSDDQQIAVWVKKPPVKEFQGLPNKFKERVNEVQTVIETENNNSIIKLWDNKIVDRDIISVYHNGKLILVKHRLNKKQKELKLPLKKGMNWIVIYAHNLGDTPPNTIGVEIIQENGATTEYTFRSDEKTNATIVIMRK